MAGNVLSFIHSQYIYRTCQKSTFSVTEGGGIGDFTFQIIVQSIFMTKNYELNNISTFVINIYSWATLNNKCLWVPSFPSFVSKRFVFGLHSANMDGFFWNLVCMILQVSIGYNLIENENRVTGKSKNQKRNSQLLFVLFTYFRTSRTISM